MNVKSKLVVVTGYVKIPNHPRSDGEYQRLGARLLEISTPPVVFLDGLSDCWLTPLVRNIGVGVDHSVGDNRRKNSLDYHIVQHQKTAWLVDAAKMIPAADILVWIDYGIFSQPGITVGVIDDFLRRLEDADERQICIPGAWRRSNLSDRTPDWHFCGSSMIVPRAHALAFHDAVMNATINRIASTNRVTWEINDWTVVEAAGVLPIRWYQGDHNETQFTNYRNG